MYSLISEGRHFEYICVFCRQFYVIHHKMAKLVDIYNSEKDPVIKRRQLPLTIYDNLTVSSLYFDSSTVIDL